MNAMERPTQLSLAWLLTETAFIAIALAGLRIIVSSGRITSIDQGMTSLVCFVASCGAIGGLFKRSAIGFALGSFIGFFVGTTLLLLLPLPMY
jgi:hypothetical protein